MSILLKRLLIFAKIIMVVKMEKYEKTAYLTLLSVTSAIAVVFLHVNSCFWQFSKESYWFSANIIECVFYFAVPIFFMITGATLIDYKERYSDLEYAKKRIKKTFIPFIIWSLIGLILEVILKKIDTSIIGLKYIFNGIVNTSIISIYWFFIPLFYIYLIIPLLTRIPKKNRKGIFTYLVILCFIINSLIPFLIKVLNIKNLDFPIYITIGNGYIFFVLIGYLLKEYDVGKLKKLIYVLAILGLLAHIIGTYYLSNKASMIVGTFKDYINVPSVLYAVGVFVFFKDVGNKIMKTKFSKLINMLSKYTFGIYLVHVHIIEGVYYICNNYLNIPLTNLYYRLFSPFIVVFLSVLLIYLLRKIPVIKHIVP